ncbi:MAG: lipid-A-disaccharide synthase [Campylobacterota bacterium]|nr:lipid-A-disaccharide synthase [Campylobacterota bacterium]
MKILVSALETSANVHLKELLKHLPKDVELSGIFDKNMGDPNYDLSSLAIMGFVDALKRLPFFLKLKNEMVTLSNDVDKVLLIDSSGFNLPLAKAIKKKYPNKQIIYYILPQAWVWKKGRVQKLEQYCDKLCSIIPFEQEMYTHKNKISYVGHPLLDEIDLFKKDLSKNNTIAFLPGSRKTEIKNLMPIYKEVIKQLPQKAILVIPAHFTNDYIEEVYGDISAFEISNDTHQTLIDVDFAFICSGTATLEAALIGTPFILCYIAKKFDYFIGNIVVKLPFVGLANIFFDKMGKPAMHYELLQDQVTVQNVLNAYEKTDKDLFLQHSVVLRHYLKNGSSQNVANCLLN